MRQDPMKEMRLTLLALFLILFTCKVTGKLGDLSWWWVTAPLWFPFVLALTLFGIGSTLLALGHFLDDRAYAKKKGVSRKEAKEHRKTVERASKALDNLARTYHPN